MHTMSLKIIPHALLLLTLGLASSLGANAADGVTAAPASAGTEQVVVPEVTRRDVKVPRLPSNNFEGGVFVGSYATQNFGTSLVTGLRLGYHVSEDVFVEAAYAQTKISDAAYRQILPGGIFPSESERLRYYNLSAGYNVLPGEVFIGAKHAKPVALYVIGGVGSTLFNDQRLATINVGAGLRVYFNDNIAFQSDAREHFFSLDLLGQRQSTKNLEFTLGLTVSY